MFHLLGVGIAFFLELLLLGKKQKSFADKILAAWLLIMMLHLLSYTFRQLQLYPQFLGIEMPFPLLHGPFLYFYTLALTRNRILPREWILHLFIPAAFYIYLIPFLTLPTEQKVYVYTHEGIGYETFMLLRDICIPLSGVLYVVLSTIVLRKHRRSIVDEFSSIEKINLLWLQYLIIWIAGIWLLVMFGDDTLIYGATVIFVFFIGYFGIRQVGIFHSVPHDRTPPTEQRVVVEDEVNEDSSEQQKQKYQKSGLTAETSETLHRQLTSLMANDKLFRESELSLAELAKRLNAPANHLSQVINEREGKNFYDYVNTLRVQEFARIASTPESRKLTLYALAQECGFNSKSSFNRYVKKVTGQSPSEIIGVPEVAKN